MTKAAVREARKQSRVRCNLSFRGGGGAHTLQGKITDLSRAGVFITTKKLLKTGSQVHLEFTLDGEKVELVGEVRWCGKAPNSDEPGVGVRFLRMSAASARTIDRVLGFFSDALPATWK